ncbi:DEAD/DEAH box helicase [Chondromyces crocatus]|uniref:Type III restriction protein res subunit n=1 Tax=Chondromyces crocatus TaxID=52 RepID=A0A0K1ERS8_CHOCO|nr:DEAD/DEAH box helicase [Chondromyces crocatus]AKT43620.1 type III restriction protein res subunit [Chondromyces crocatus]
MKYTPRDYQKRAIEMARRAIRSGKKRPLIVAPTGAGKTVIACAIVESAMEKGSRTLFMAHRRELIEQTSRKLDEMEIDHGVIKAGHPRVRPELPIQVGSVQTLARRLGKGKDPFRLVIVDEAHHAPAKSYKAVLEASPDAVVLGLTATPYRADGVALGDVFDALVEVTTIEALIDAGHLVEPRVFGRRVPDLSRVRKVGPDYNLGQLAEVMDQGELVEDIVGTWREKAEGRTTVVFAVNIAHSQHIARAFAKAGIAAGHVDGEMGEDERAAVLGRLARGEIQVLSNCNILTEGWDLPQCSCVVLARPTRSRSLWKQMCGRALRPAPELKKVDCLILDHAGCWKRFGFLTDPEKNSLEEKERESGGVHFECPFCGEGLLGWPRHCPACGSELPRHAPPGEPRAKSAARAEGVMVELRSLEERITLYEGWAKLARARGRAPGWVAIEFKNFFGRYPKRLEMGEDRSLWTRYDEALRRGVWVEE